MKQGIHDIDMTVVIHRDPLGSGQIATTVTVLAELAEIVAILIEDLNPEIQ